MLALACAGSPDEAQKADSHSEAGLTDSPLSLTDASVSEEGCPALSPPFEPAAFCPSGQPIAGPVPVIPRPRQVFHLAEPAELASPTLGICGAEQEERDYLMERLDGLPVTEAAADFPADRKSVV